MKEHSGVRYLETVFGKTAGLDTELVNVQQDNKLIPLILSVLINIDYLHLH